MSAWRFNRRLDDFEAGLKGGPVPKPLKDYEFSRLTMNEHWSPGYDDADTTLKHPEIFERPANKEGVSVFDTLKKACGGPYNAEASE